MITSVVRAAASRSLTCSTTLAALFFTVGAPAPLGAQEPTVLRLFEEGRYQEAAALGASLEQRKAAGPDVLFMTGQSLFKLDQPARAKEVFGRIGGPGEADPWRAIGQSAVALADGNTDGALASARRATELSPDQFFGYYQLGLVLARREDFGGSAEAFERATQLNPNFAYAHYYAGMAHYRVKRVDLMTRHFEAFIRLAPNAPERPAVEGLVRTLRGR